MRASRKFSDANMLALHFWQMSCSIRTKRSDKPALQRSSKVSRLIRSKTWVDPNLLSKALFVNRRTRKLHIKKHVCSKEVSFQSRTLTETMLFMLLRGSQRRPIRARAWTSWSLRNKTLQYKGSDVASALVSHKDDRGITCGMEHFWHLWAICQGQLRFSILVLQPPRADPNYKCSLSLMMPMQLVRFACALTLVLWCCFSELLAKTIHFSSLAPCKVVLKPRPQPFGWGSFEVEVASPKWLWQDCIRQHACRLLAGIPGIDFTSCSRRCPWISSLTKCCLKFDAFSFHLHDFQNRTRPGSLLLVGCSANVVG